MHDAAMDTIDNKILEKIKNAIDSLPSAKNLIVAIDGPAGAGKSTLAEYIQKVYDCNVFHMDDYFLRPEQKTKQRLNIPGENVDHERFLKEIILPVNLYKPGESVVYRPYNCHKLELENEITVPYKRLNIVEGSYSLNKELIGYYDLRIFLGISKELQEARIRERCNPQLADRFFNEWIPLEDKYFEECDIINKSDLKIAQQ